MKGLMTMGPLYAMRRFRRAGSEIPMKIIAADRREEYKSHEPSGRGSPQKQPGGLPDHDYGAYGDIEAAKDKIIDYFSKHA